MVKVGDKFWIFIPATNKLELATCIEIDKNRILEHGNYKFTYTPWPITHYNFLTKEDIDKMKPLTPTEYILYG